MFNLFGRSKRKNIQISKQQKSMYESRGGMNGSEMVRGIAPSAKEYEEAVILFNNYCDNCKIEAQFGDGTGIVCLDNTDDTPEYFINLQIKNEEVISPKLLKNLYKLQAKINSLFKINVSYEYNYIDISFTLFIESNTTYYYLNDDSTAHRLGLPFTEAGTFAALVNWSHQTPDPIQTSIKVCATHILFASGSSFYNVNMANNYSVTNLEMVDDIDDAVLITEEVSYIGNFEGDVVALRHTDCEQLWHYEAKGAIEAAPEVCDTQVYICGSDNSLVCLERTTGEFLWCFEMEARPIGARFYQAVEGGIVYCANKDGCLYVIDTKNGQLLQKITVPDAIASTPAIDERHIYIANDKNLLLALSRTTGEVVWQYKAQWGEFSTPTIDGDALLVTGRRINTLYCLEKQTGELIWAFPLGNHVKAEPIVVNEKGGEDSTVYIGSENGHLHAINRQTGGERWFCETGVTIKAAPAITENGLFLGGGNGRIYSFKKPVNQYDLIIQSEADNRAMASGGPCRSGSFHQPALINSPRLQWQHKIDTNVSNSPVCYQGHAYYGDELGRLTKVNLSTGLALWSYQTAKRAYTSRQTDDPNTGSIQTACTISDGVAYFCASDSYLHAIDVNTGKSIWKFKSRLIAHSAPVVANGRVYFSAEHHFALNAKTGEQEWLYWINSSDGIYSAATVSGNALIIDEVIEHQILCIDIPTGEKRWAISREEDAHNNMAVCGYICVMRFSTKVWAIDIRDRRLLWEYTGDRWLANSPIMNETSVVIIDQGGKAVCLDNETGDLLWHIEGVDGSVDTVICGECIYLVDSHNQLVACNLMSGNVLWVKPMGDASVRALWPLDDGLLVVMKGGTLSKFIRNQ